MSNLPHNACGRQDHFARRRLCQQPTFGRDSQCKFGEPCPSIGSDVSSSWRRSKNSITLLFGIGCIGGAFGQVKVSRGTAASSAAGDRGVVAFDGALAANPLPVSAATLAAWTSASPD